MVLSQEPFNFNTRAAGIDKEYALIAVDEVLIEWADEIVCMDASQESKLKAMTDKPVYCLGIKDNFEYRNEDLISIITSKYNEKLYGEPAIKPKRRR